MRSKYWAFIASGIASHIFSRPYCSHGKDHWDPETIGDIGPMLGYREGLADVDWLDKFPSVNWAHVATAFEHVAQLHYARAD